MSHKNIKGRFAPSPSGRMHLGNAYAAYLSWLSAKSKGGAWLLRIEDLDPQRCRMEYALQLEEDLRWLGFEWDEGGTEQRGDNGPYVQSQRNEIYEHYLSVLREKGITYPCHCTRAEIMATQAPHEGKREVKAIDCSLTSIEGTSIPNKASSSVRKILRDGQLLLFYNNRFYTLLGIEN